MTRFIITFSCMIVIIFFCFFFLLLSKRGNEFEEIIVAPLTPGLQVSHSQLTDDNEDFSNRQRFHQTAVIRPLVNSEQTYSNVQILR